MHVFEKNIKDLGLNISEPPDAVANYVPFKIVENLVYVSGQAPSKNGKMLFTGKVGKEISEEDLNDNWLTNFNKPKNKVYEGKSIFH